MSPPADLIKAIRTGLLSEVVAALDAGAQVELNDGQGDSGLPLAMACFMGFAEIVRELALRGAKVNFPDNRDSKSPLSMAIRGGRNEVVKVLIELGAVVPPGVQTGLTKQELMVAEWKAQHFGAGSAGGDPSGNSPSEVEEIKVTGCYGTDTDVLDAEMRRAIETMGKK
ncbi:MAG: ankyrin repeat domain-containing protein [Propionivibrio sp.]|uniref:ankyrin repeat domain-containing protein n=1 Tax=Propionivibrio sp. TaxID=2212460 RepID=UPI0025ECB039|nr:ankyrin repeat domain-containing protein [Propionivibrio sp.]MBK8894773.1 ankyrin repeat domain-containing protein [Propionivibrio sp.]